MKPLTPQEKIRKLKTVAKKKQKLPKDTYIGATVRLFDSYRDNLVGKLLVLYLKARENPGKWCWLDSLLSGMVIEPLGFHGVALDNTQVQKVYALWFKQFECVRCGKAASIIIKASA